jgi:hypothetical protein
MFCVGTPKLHELQLDGSHLYVGSVDYGEISFVVSIRPNKFEIYSDNDIENNKRLIDNQISTIRELAKGREKVVFYGIKRLSNELRNVSPITCEYFENAFNELASSLGSK